MADPEVAREQRAARIQGRADRKKKADDAKKAKAEAAKAAKEAKAVQAQQQKATGSRATTNTSSLPPPPAPGPRQKKKKAPPEGAEEEEDDTIPCLHPDDPANFLKLSKALRILLARAITNQQIDEAFDLLSRYCAELVAVCLMIYTFTLHSPSLFTSCMAQR